MKLPLASLLPLALASAASPPTPQKLAPGIMRLWMPESGPALFTGEGISVAIASAPCDARHRSVGCAERRANNRAVVTVSAPGQAPFRVDTDDQFSYYRLSIVRFDPRSAPGVVIENESGGSAGDVSLQLVVPQGKGYRLVRLPGPGGAPLQGGLPNRLGDLSGDGKIDLVLGDGRFAIKFGCNACTPRPPRVFTLRAGAFADVSRDPAYAPILRADMARLGPVCTSKDPTRNGACAAFVADAVRVGAFDKAWALMLASHERDPAKRAAAADPNARAPFPETLRAFLRQAGYIS